MSRRLEDLLPEIETKARTAVAACQARGVDVLIYCTHRTPEEQAELFTYGRTRPGKRKTDARPWFSWHQYHRALDAVPLIHGTADWSYVDREHDGIPDEWQWKVMVAEFEHAGFEWAGRWTTFVEFVHFQITDGLSYDQAKADLRARGLLSV